MKRARLFPALARSDYKFRAVEPEPKQFSMARAGGGYLVNQTRLSLF